MLRRGLRRLAVGLATLSIREDDRPDGDVAVVLGGAPRYRAPTAVALWRAGRVRGIVAVGGSRGHQEALRTVEVLAALGVPADAVVLLAEDAPGTWDEAQRVAAAARERGWRRVVLVTSAYHTRRAGHLFETALGDGVSVCVQPAVDEPWRPDNWWRQPLHRRLLLAEPLKLLSWRSGARAAWVRAGGRGWQARRAGR
jgi:uncharacterized SAM-binding protein YcdF (DUF218 family)